MLVMDEWTALQRSGIHVYTRFHVSGYVRVKVRVRFNKTICKVI